jgi:Zn-dependent peptidase ImmA (M78 family)
MNQDPKTIMRDVRALVPARGLQEHEATGIAERQATRLLGIFDQHEPPVEVGLIAELPRIEVRVVPNRELAGLSGMSQWVKQHGRWLIAINRDDSQTRRRFTLAHEFKHVLDNPFINVLYPKSKYGGRSADDRAEQMCDYFAACLLMPRPWVKRLWTQGLQDTGMLAATFNVSPAAMDRRLQDIGLVEARKRWNAPTSPESVQRYFRLAPVTVRAGLLAA